MLNASYDSTFHQGLSDRKSCHFYRFGFHVYASDVRGQFVTRWFAVPLCPRRIQKPRVQCIGARHLFVIVHHPTYIWAFSFTYFVFFSFFCISYYYFQLYCTVSCVHIRVRQTTNARVYLYGNIPSSRHTERINRRRPAYACMSYSLISLSLSLSRHIFK